jgi:hypothetical protein
MILLAFLMKQLVNLSSSSPWWSNLKAVASAAELQNSIVSIDFTDFIDFCSFSDSVHQFWYNFEVLWVEIGSIHTRTARRTRYCSLVTEISRPDAFLLFLEFTVLLETWMSIFLSKTELLLWFWGNRLVNMSAMTMGSFHVFIKQWLRYAFCSSKAAFAQKPWFSCSLK